MNKKRFAINGNTNLMLRLVAGIYLLYSAYSLIKLYVTDTDRESWKIVFPIIAVIFFLTGLYFTVSAIKKYYAVSMEPEEEIAVPARGPEPNGTDSFLDAALERVAACVREQRDILDTFNGKEYAAGFSRFMKTCGAVFDDAARSEEEEEKIGEMLAERLLYELETEYSRLPKNAARAQRDIDRRVIALYLVPMVCKKDERGCREFAAALAEGWNRNYPDCRFAIGSYEEILAGFKKNLSSIFGIRE